MDWQTITALTCVAVTLAVFAYRLIQSRGKSSCEKCGSCGTEKKGAHEFPKK